MGESSIAQLRNFIIKLYVQYRHNDKQHRAQKEMWAYNFDMYEDTVDQWGRKHVIHDQPYAEK